MLKFIIHQQGNVLIDVPLEKTGPEETRSTYLGIAKQPNFVPLTDQKDPTCWHEVPFCPTRDCLNHQLSH